MDSLVSDFPDSTRLWVYVAAERLSEDMQDALQDRLDTFLDGWVSHQRPVRGRAVIRDDRIVLIAATVEGGSVSGCGIDASVHALEEASVDLDISWAGPLDIVYRDASGDVCVTSRSAFRDLVADGEVTGETLVLDPSVTRVKALRSGAFERAAADSWHARIFKIPATA